MSTQKAKFELFQRLEALGFTYDESAQLRRIEMTLQRWAELECNGDIQRNETSGKPFRYFGLMLPSDQQRAYPIADREAGALKRLARIVDARNRREDNQQFVIAYHQGDCRGCMLYLVKKSDLQGQLIDQVYNRGLAVCA